MNQRSASSKFASREMLVTHLDMLYEMPDAAQYGILRISHNLPSLRSVYPHFRTSYAPPFKHKPQPPHPPLIHARQPDPPT